MKLDEVNQDDKSIKRQKILNLAREIFCEKGFHAVGTQEICQQAGILKGTLYHFFSSKLDLALEALSAYSLDARSEFDAIATADLAPTQRLIRLFDLEREMMTRQKRKFGKVLGCFFGNYTLELASVESSAAKKIEEILELWSLAFTPIVRDLIKESLIPKQAIPEACRTILAFLQGAILVSKAKNDPEFVVKQGRLVLRLLGGRDLISL